MDGDKINHSELKGTLTLQESSGLVLRDGDEIATATSLRREREMIDCVNRGIGSFERLGRDNQFIASDRLRPEQKRVVEFVLDSRDRAVNIRGGRHRQDRDIAGTAAWSLLEAGREILAVAPTMSAVEELQKVGFADAMTVERLLQDQRAQSRYATRC